MADTGNRAPPAPNDAQAAELKMRRALGLHGTGHGKNQSHTAQQRPEQARQRHRFVQDGGVPVVVLNHRADDSAVLKERISELERQLDTERAQHAGTRRSLHDAQATVQAMETRRVHTDLAHQEALTQERRALATAQQALNEALAEAAQASSRRSRSVAATVEPVAVAPVVKVEPEPKPAAPVEAVPGEAPAPKKRGRPRTRPVAEPKPVRWWTPSFRAKTKA